MADRLDVLPRGGRCVELIEVSGFLRGFIFVLL